MKKADLWNEWEDNWSIEKGHTEYHRIKQFDKEFIAPKIDFDKLKLISSRRTPFEILVDTIKKIPKQLLLATGLIWIIVAIWLIPKVVLTFIKKYYFLQINDYPIFFLASTGFIFFSVLVIYLLVKILPFLSGKYVNNGPVNYFSFSMASLSMILFLFFIHNSITSLVSPFNPKYGPPQMVDSQHLSTLKKDDLNELIVDFKSNDISQYTRDEVNLVKVAALEKGDLKHAYLSEAILDNPKFEVRGSSYAAELNQSLDSVHFEDSDQLNLDTIGIGYLTENKTAIEESYQRMFDSWSLDMDGEKTTNTSDEDYLVLEKLGYPKKALMKLNDQLREVPLDPKNLFNFEKFVSKYFVEDIGSYDSIMIENRLKLVNVSDSSLDVAFGADLFNTQDTYALNNAAVRLESESEYSKAFIAYYLADQRDPFERNLALQHNYRDYRTAFDEVKYFNNDISKFQNSCMVHQYDYLEMFLCLSSEVDKMNVNASKDYFDLLNNANVEKLLIESDIARMENYPWHD